MGRGEERGAQDKAGRVKEKIEGTWHMWGGHVRSGEKVKKVMRVRKKGSQLGREPAQNAGPGGHDDLGKGQHNRATMQGLPWVQWGMRQGRSWKGGEETN